MSLIAITTIAIRPDGNAEFTAICFLDGIEISEGEYWAVQCAALDRAFAEVAA